MMHESGTGGAPKYGVVAQMPISGLLDFPVVNLSSPRAVTDYGSVGYYHTELLSGITVELAGTNHAGYFQYSFPSNSSKSVIVDVGHFLPSFRGLGWSQSYLGGNIKIHNDGHYEGNRADANLNGADRIEQARRALMAVGILVSDDIPDSLFSRVMINSS